MTHLMILTDACYAGHCTTGGSNKVWAACLALEQTEEQAVVQTDVSATAEVVLLCVHGPFGASLRREPPQRLALQAARKVLRRKWQEKTGKGYTPVAFPPYLAAFGHPFGLSLQLPPPVPSSPAVLSPAETPVGTTASPASPWRYTAAQVKAISLPDMMALLTETRAGTPARFAVSEKANGERCLVEFDGADLRAYNRKGQSTSVPPEGAIALRRLGHSFVIDGERLIREQAGHFVVFDVLEWQGESLLALPYRLRLTRLVRGMQRAGLLKDDCLTPTLAQARANCSLTNLSVLLAVPGAEQARRVLREVQASGGEGVVIRNLDAPYQEGGFKYKFLADLDAFVIGIEPGLSEGSLTLALIRPTDGAAVEIGHVRSGLTDQDVRTVRQLLAQGHFPVFRVRYLPASTVGMTLVQPQTSLADRRTDKTAWECSTDQFGAEKASLIAQARPIKGVTIPQTDGKPSSPCLPA